MEQVDECPFDDLFQTNVKGLYFHGTESDPADSRRRRDPAECICSGQERFRRHERVHGTKAAVRSFGRTLASELAPRRIRVNTISPGPVATPILGKMGLPSDAASFVVGTELFVDGGLAEL